MTFRHAKSAALQAVLGGRPHDEHQLSATWVKTLWLLLPHRKPEERIISNRKKFQILSILGSWWPRVKACALAPLHATLTPPSPNCLLTLNCFFSATSRSLSSHGLACQEEPSGRTAENCRLLFADEADTLRFVQVAGLLSPAAVPALVAWRNPNGRVRQIVVSDFLALLPVPFSKRPTLSPRAVMRTGCGRTGRRKRRAGRRAGEGRRHSGRLAARTEEMGGDRRRRRHSPAVASPRLRGVDGLGAVAPLENWLTRRRKERASHEAGTSRRRHEAGAAWLGEAG